MATDPMLAKVRKLLAKAEDRPPRLTRPRSTPRRRRS